MRCIDAITEKTATQPTMMLRARSGSIERMIAADNRAAAGAAIKVYRASNRWIEVVRSTTINTAVGKSSHHPSSTAVECSNDGMTNRHPTVNSAMMLPTRIATKIAVGIEYRAIVSYDTMSNSDSTPLRSNNATTSKRRPRSSAATATKLPMRARELTSVDGSRYR